MSTPKALRNPRVMLVHSSPASGQMWEVHSGANWWSVSLRDGEWYVVGARGPALKAATGRGKLIVDVVKAHEERVKSNMEAVKSARQEREAGSRLLH